MLNCNILFGVVKCSGLVMVFCLLNGWRGIALRCVHSPRNKKKGSSVLRPDDYAMLMNPNKGEIAVYGCHCPGDMVLRMRRVMAIPRS